MATTNLQAGGDLGGDEPREVLVLGAKQRSFGPMGPILRALGLGFALGLVITGVLALFAR